MVQGNDPHPIRSRFLYVTVLIVGPILINWVSGRLIGPFTGRSFPAKGALPMSSPAPTPPAPTINPTEIVGNGGGSVILAITTRNVGFYLGGLMLIVVVTYVIYIQNKRHKETLALISQLQRSGNKPSNAQQGELTGDKQQ